MKRQVESRKRITLLAVMLTAAVGFGTVLTPGDARAITYEAPRGVRESVEARFVSGPTVKTVDGTVLISFEVSKAVDVEAAVLDDKGNVVRHLAAGLLGKHAPAPFAKGTLKQALMWDGKDDVGRPAAKGPHSVRVRLGAMPKLDKQFGAKAGITGPIVGMATGIGGEVYVLFRSWVGRGRNEIAVFNRKGEYVRTVMPYPAATPPERAKSVGQLDFDGQKVPVVYSGHAHALSPMTPGLPRQNMAWNPKGHLVVVSTLATSFEHGLPRHLLAFHPQGGAPEGMKFVGPEIRPPTGITWGHGEGDDPCFEHVAVSPDGKWIYYTHSTFYNLHGVYRLSWAEDKGSGMEAAWLGQDNRPGSDDRHLNDPQGLAVDSRGRVFVCDRGNTRVVVASPEGEMLGSIPVEDPEQIAVHPKSGELYVLCRQAPTGNRPKDIGPMSMAEYRAWKKRRAARSEKASPRRRPRLVKLSAWKRGTEPRELARLDRGFGLMALDAEGPAPQLWVTGKGGLMPVLDKGRTFEVGAPTGRGRGQGHPGRVVGDPERNRVLVYNLSSNYKVDAFDLASGEKTRILDCVSDFDVAPDGSIYGTGKYNQGELLHFTADGKPLNFKGSDSHKVKIGGHWIGGINLGARGMTVSSVGDIYVLRAANQKGVANRVDVFGPDGKRKEAALVDGMGLGDCGIGVDAAGNVYLGVNIKPKDAILPQEFRGKVPAAAWLCWAQGKWQYRPAPWYYSMRNEYIYHLGAVMKFGPEGGAFYGRGGQTYRRGRNANPVVLVENAPSDAPEYRTGYLLHPVKVVGAKWRYPGMGIVPASERYWGDPACVCMTSRLGVDGFGRVYVPNCFGFCVDVLDTDGNRLTRFGKYGNVDDAGPAIHFAWPAFVDAAGGKVFVSDSVTRKLTVIGFDYAAEKLVAVR